ncbi:related to PAF acetylhydrolase family protein [Fusarium fujikuroi]|nr:related to PAF acetylhydrolase family protein [Fusarium fujikuroi]SCO21005.1 related to PAF acetylhydrolase family protein [Fusarium fujikuroi]SCV59888.1 related to PAF acetylhydrolase family protein [Fusarium fujikuroi]
MRLSTHLASVMAGLSAVSTGLLIPLVSSGPYSVGLDIKTLIDESRWDPYAPIDIPQKRRVLISTFAPVDTQENSCPHGEVNVPYMPPKTGDVFGRQAEAMGLPSGVFEDLQLKFCRLPDVNRLQKHALKNGTKLPVVIFFPGRGVSRLMYSSMARSVASHGYIVITVDHAYDASIIEYPDGTDITGVVGEANKTVLERSAKVRSQDISFIIDQIKGNATAIDQFGLSETGSVFVLGHSIGGATAVSTSFSDDRIRGAINLDGDMLVPVVKAGLENPLFLIGRPHSRDQGPSWNETWNSQRGPSMMLQIDGITHQSFLDAPLLVSLRDVPEGSRDKVQAALGTINGRRMASLVIQLTVSILEYVLDGAESRLCRVVGDQPEVTVLENKGINCS